MTKQELWRKCQLLMILACGTFPVVMIILNKWAPEMAGWGWLFSAAYVVLAMVGIHAKGKIRMGVGIGLSAVMIAVTFLLAPAQLRLGTVVAAVFCSGLLIWSLRMGGWSSKQEIPLVCTVVGMICHLVGQITLHADRVAGGEGLAQHTNLFLVALFGFCLLTMLSMNRQSLTDASGKRQSVPDTMRRRNTVMTIALFVVGILTALLPSAVAGLGDLMLKAIKWLVAVVTRLIPDAPNESEFQKDMPPEFLPGQGQGQDQGLVLNPVVEKIAAFVGALISLAFVVFILWRIFRTLRSKIQELVVSLGKFSASVSEDYVDEVTDTRDEGTEEKLQRHRRNPKLSAREERTLPPGERIRYRYRRILSKHPDWVPGTTARESLPEELARVYEKARYSGSEMTEEEAAAFTEGTSKL